MREIEDSKGRGRSSGGFTLIELILYVTLAAGLLFLVSVLFAAILEARVKSTAVSDVEGQGAAVMNLITQTVRNATGVNSPLAGATSSVLSLAVSSPAKNPTVFDSLGGTLRIAEGGTAPLALTAANVTVYDLIFRNLSRLNTSSTLRIEFRLVHVNQEGRREYDYSSSFYGSAEKR